MCNQTFRICEDATLWHFAGSQYLQGSYPWINILPPLPQTRSMTSPAVACATSGVPLCRTSGCLVVAAAHIILSRDIDYNFQTYNFQNLEMHSGPAAHGQRMEAAAAMQLLIRVSSYIDTTLCWCLPALPILSSRRLCSGKSDYFLTSSAGQPTITAFQQLHPIPAATRGEKV